MVRCYRHASDIPASGVCSIRILFISLYSPVRARRARGAIVDVFYMLHSLIHMH